MVWLRVVPYQNEGETSFNTKNSGWCCDRMPSSFTDRLFIYLPTGWNLAFKYEEHGIWEEPSSL